MMPISVRDNSWAIGAGAQRANDTVNRFNQGLMDAGQGFESGLIKSRLFSGEWDQKHNEELQNLYDKILNKTATAKEIERYNEMNDDRSIIQKAKDYFSSPMPNSVKEEDYYVPDLEELGLDAGTIDTSKVKTHDEHGNDLSGEGIYEDIDVNVPPSKKIDLGTPDVISSLPSLPAKAPPRLRDVDLPLRAAETAGIATGYLPMSEQDKIKDNQRFLDEQAFQEAERKAQASTIDNLRKQGEFNANENVLAEAINKEGDLTGNEKVATVNSIAKIKGIAPVEAAAENMSPENLNALVNEVRAKTEGPLSAEARRALKNIETQGFTVANILELAKVNALSNLNLPYDKANSTDVQAAVQSSIMQKADSNLIKQNSKQLIGDSRMQAREFVNSGTTPPVPRSGQFAPQQAQAPAQQETQNESLLEFIKRTQPNITDAQIEALIEAGVI